MSDNTPQKRASITRRHFFELLGIGAVATATAGSAALAVDYLAPRVLTEPPTKFIAGTPGDFPPGSVRLFREHGAYVVRTAEGTFRALSATCTHLGCMTGWKAAEGIIACPCHGSRFGLDGHVTGGPAPRPLDALLISLSEEGMLVVDTAVPVARESVLKV
jgi:cytochrome b6-f complex iron-sulfur subunit